MQLLTDLIMAQNKETRLWHELKDLDKNWHFTRIESSTVNGIPDVHCVVNRQVFWIELKANASKNCGLSKYQINWHIKYLKAGGAAFVPEDPKAFLSLEEVKEIIIDAGGIPCYPVLLDFGNGNFTDYEADKEKLLHELIKNDVYSIELIPGRNEFKILKDFVTYFNEKGFVITFGSEHNTPQLDPMRITCKGGIELDVELNKMNYEGTAVIAAHQYLIARGKEGYLNGQIAKTGEKENFIELGKAVITKFISPL